MNKVRVIRYVGFSELRDPENYYTERLLYYPLVNETELKMDCSHYQEAYQKVARIVEHNAKRYEH